jgi:hypothetical protein
MLGDDRLAPTSAGETVMVQPESKPVGAEFGAPRGAGLDPNGVGPTQASGAERD